MTDTLSPGAAMGAWPGLTASVGPGLPVDAPTAEPPRVSLLTSAAVTEQRDERDWANGLRFMPWLNRLPDNPYWWDCPDPGGQTPEQVYGSNGKLLPNPRAVREYRPFDIWTGFRTTGGDLRAYGNDWLEAEARRVMEAYQSEAIEEELWTGARVATPASFPNGFFRDANLVELNGGTALGVVRAFAELEQGIADRQAGPGMIHAQPRTVSLWTLNGLVTPSASGRQLRSALGTLVVPGRGYPGSGDGVTAGVPASAYAYGTGMIHVWLGPIRTFVSDAETDGAAGLNEADVLTDTNDLRVRVERTVAAWWDGIAQVGIEVTHTTAH